MYSIKKLDVKLKKKKFSKCLKYFLFFIKNKSDLPLTG